jgi:hypothetical protein
MLFKTSGVGRKDVSNKGVGSIDVGSQEILLVSQGVISRNYDDSQYDGLILDLIIQKEEPRVAHLAICTRLALSHSLRESLGSFAF